MGVVFFPSLPFMGVMLFPSFWLGNVSGEGGASLALLFLFFFFLLFFSLLFSFLLLLFSFLPLLFFFPFILPFPLISVSLSFPSFCLSPLSFASFFCSPLFFFFFFGGTACTVLFQDARDDSTGCNPIVI